jgi:anti-sigma regulatory factor (Ser/Thr protein kinase)
MRIPGGDDAPTRARRSVRSQLEGHIPAATTSDAALLVSELVTNSVVHANVGPHRALTVEVRTLDDRVRIAVTDPGSRLTPCMLPPDPETPGGLGLLLVDELCETWGVRQDSGSTCVWCELLLDQSPVGSDHAGGERTDAQACPSAMRQRRQGQMRTPD